MLHHLIFLSICVFCATSEVLNLYEGSKCKWKEAGGECVSVYRCASSFIDSMAKDYAPICSFRGKEPIVCCTDCELVNDTRNMIWNQQKGFLLKTGQKAEDKCIDFINTLPYSCKDNSEYVIRRFFNAEENCYSVITPGSGHGFAAGGRNAVREEFPHMALLGYGYDVTAADWLCGGTVISERFILTAGHCLSHPAVGQVKYVALGILLRTDPPELWQKYNVKRIIPHPKYKSPSKYHDIALLETETTMSFGKNVLPACLHTEGAAVESASATGWGALGYRRELADNLQAVDVARFSEDECSKFYPPHRHLKEGYNHTTQMCYGDRDEPKDTCEGDSGGPLQSRAYDKYSCVYTVLGVTSYGRQCGLSFGSGIYTRVYHYVPWIESIVWP